jgi:PilZ domain-containing protein
VAKAFAGKEKRRWARLKLAIPVFVRTQTAEGKEALEFATAVNVSAGGALLVVRRSLNKSARVVLEVPSAPIAPVNGMPQSSRTIRAKAIWIKHLDDYHLLGLKFSQPLSTDYPIARSSRRFPRKSPSAM